MPPELLVKFIQNGPPPDVVAAVASLYLHAVKTSDRYDVCLLCLIETLADAIYTAEMNSAIDHDNVVQGTDGPLQ